MGKMTVANRNVELLDPLTPRELQVAQLLALGLSNRDIAALLCIGEGTVKTHVEHILGKLAVTDRVQAAVWFARTQPEVPLHDTRGGWKGGHCEREFEEVESEVQALVRQGEDSPTRILNRLRQRGYVGGVEPIKDYLYPGWR